MVLRRTLCSEKHYMTDGLGITGLALTPAAQAGQEHVPMPCLTRLTDALER